MVDKIYLKKELEQRNTYRFNNWEGVKLLQRKGRKHPDMLKSLETRLRRESTDKFNLTGWIVDN